MALQKSSVNINFAQGLNTKVDPNQVPVGQFLALQNSVFTTGNRLTKRNGYGSLTSLPNSNQTTLTTYNSNLIATGSDLFAYSADNGTWIDKGNIQPINLSVKSVVRNSNSQTSPDSSVASNGLICVAYNEGSGAFYQINDSVTGQQILSKQALPSGAQNPKVVVLGNFFIVTFTYSNAGTPNLAYIPVSMSNPTVPGATIQLSAQVASTTTAYDICLLNTYLYFVWNGSDATIKAKFMDVTQIQSSNTVVATAQASRISVTTDGVMNRNRIWVTYIDSSTHNGYSICYSNFFSSTILASTQVITNMAINALSTICDLTGILNIFYEVNNTYGFTPNAATHYINTVTVTSGGAVSSTTTILRSVGLASKAFITSLGSIYMMAAYGETSQPTYFLITALGAIYARLAYSNGGGYVNTISLPSVSSLGSTYYCSYLFKDFLTSVNKTTDQGLPSAALYTQTGVNIVEFQINQTGQYSSEIAADLHLTGGMLWMFDSVKPVEHGFHVWPENIALTTSASGGTITAGTYFYQFTYEWTDNQGKLHRSAPSIPVSAGTLSGSTSSVTINVPTLRLTYKTSPNAVRIVGYRWSVLQQAYYQFTSVTSPVANDPTIDYVTITDTSSDSQILGNTLLYTTGGVVEDIAAPACIASCLYRNRLILLDAEDQNLLWYSKQVLEDTPVEMSDLFTIYIAPSTGTQGSTGPLTAVSAMDDKLIAFKKNAIYYITGNGPDNTGSNNDFSDPIFITSSVGCPNPASIVLMPSGLMFQSDKGIWLLGRDLSTQYIGAAVEAYNSFTVKSASTIPGTNQVRFVMSNGLTLMYDYFYNQWGTFSTLSAVSATLFNDLHTYLNSSGQVYQETPGSYLDGSNPVLMSFTTSWVSLAGLQGFERFYFMYLLGTYYTPFLLNMQISYDYNSYSGQSIMVSPDNFTPPWGGEPVWGSSPPWGGPGNTFEARIFPQVQKCETFQISMKEIYDPSFGVQSGAGLSLSGLNLIIGAKKGYRTSKSASRSFG